MRATGGKALNNYKSSQLADEFVGFESVLCPVLCFKGILILH